MRGNPGPKPAHRIQDNSRLRFRVDFCNGLVGISGEFGNGLARAGREAADCHEIGTSVTRVRRRWAPRSPSPPVSIIPLTCNFPRRV